MATFDREELLAKLADARPALSSVAAIPALSHFWFDKKYVYAYDGGLGIRLPFESELDCGVPGKILLDLLRTSALKEVFLDMLDGTLVLQMGKDKVKLATLDNEAKPWNFPTVAPKKSPHTLVISEGLIEAFNQVKLVRTAAAKPAHPQSIHHGITIMPQKEDLEVYATDSVSIAQVIVTEKADKGLPNFVIPWGFVERVLELVEPGAVLHILDNCLLLITDGVMLCSNLLELPEDPDLPGVLERHMTDNKVSALPVGLQPVLDRAAILAGADDPTLTITVSGTSLQLTGEYVRGSVDTKFILKGKGTDGTGRFRADRVARALPYANSFIIGKTAIVFFGGDNFLYLLATTS